MCKNSEHLNQFLVLLCDCMPNLKHFMSIDKLLKNVYVLRTGTGKSLTTALYRETTKPEHIFDKIKTTKKSKNKKTRTCF